MAKIPLKELSKSDQSFIKKKVITLFYHVWVERDSHTDEETGMVYTSNFIYVYVKMKFWVRALYVLFSPLIALFFAVKVGIEEFAENMSGLKSLSKPFSVFQYRNEELKDN